MVPYFLRPQRGNRAQNDEGSEDGALLAWHRPSAVLLSLHESSRMSRGSVMWFAEEPESNLKRI
jgi:hypothetical protein